MRGSCGVCVGWCPYGQRYVVVVIVVFIVVAVVVFIVNIASILSHLMLHLRGR